MGYKPRAEAERALRYAKERIDALPYKVSNRWAFYRVLQELGYSKKDYKKWIKWQSRARKNFWGGYTPDIFEDDTRKTYWYGSGYDSFAQWVESLKYDEPVYDAFKLNGRIVVCCYEARAMHQQFEHYVGRYRVPLIPFAGDYTIEPKWRVAKKLEEWHEEYNLPIVVLYFGDLDRKGQRIPKDAFKDIRAWCSAPFEFRWCGLNHEHVQKYKLPENPERPGDYQWEALDDPQAAEIILGELDKVWGRGAVARMMAKEKRDAEKWRKMLKRLIGT